MLIVAALLLVAQQATPPASATPAPVAAEPKKVCRREQSLGTIFSKRVCHTPAEWAAIDAENTRTAERFGDVRDSARSVGQQSR